MKSLTLAIEKGQDGWYVGSVEEIPAVMSQGKTIEELKENILDALNLYLETMRLESKKTFSGRKIFHRKFEFA